MASPSPPLDDCSRLVEVLLAVGDPSSPKLSGLAKELEARIDDLRSLLDTPPKNDASRAKLKSGILTLDGVEHQLNENFIQETLQLADDFNMDEAQAALLLHRGAAESKYLDRSPFQSAVFLFHTRRRNILESIRLILSCALNSEIHPQIRQTLEHAAHTLTSSTDSRNAGSFMDKCISAMTGVRQSVQQLREKEKHAQTLRLEPSPGFKEDLDLQVRFLTNQHQALASIIFYLLKQKRATVSGFKNLLNMVKSFEHYDIFTCHHILPLYAYINMLCATDSPLSFEETIQLHKEMVKNYKEAPWPLRYVQASIQMLWLSEFNGLCNDPPSTNAPSRSTLDYQADIFNPSKSALTDGAFEFLLAVSSDVSQESSLNSAKEDLHRFLQSRVSPMEDQKLLTSDFKSLVVSQLETFIDSFISNMADVLKEIKTREEEDVLLGQRMFENELERFFLVIHYVYLGRRDAGMAFWSDPESNLHGFIYWASARQTPFMAATFSYMLASLSFGKECAEQTHRFLLDEVSPGTKNRRAQYLSWDYILKQFQQYVGQLEKRQQQLVPVSSHRPPPPSMEMSEPAPEMSMMLDGFMRLIGQVVQECPEAREWLLKESPNCRIMAILIQGLLNQQASIQLWDSIFSTISAFLTDKNEPLNSEVWEAIDRWALGSSTPSNALQVGAVPGRSFAQGGSDKLDSIVTSVHPAEAFVRLLAALVSLPVEDTPFKDALPFPENLGSSNRISGIDPYIDFVLATIFSNTTSKNLPPDLPLVPDKQESPTERLSRNQYRKFRPALQLSCLEFIYTCLSTFNENLIGISTNLGATVDAAINSTSLATYTKLHPFGRVMEHILTEKCFSVLFEILKLGVEDLAGIEAPSAVVETVLMTIKILDIAMSMKSTYNAFHQQDDNSRRTNITSSNFPSLEDAVLHHLDMVVYLGLYIGSEHQAVTLAALGLLEKLAVAPNLTTTSESTFGQVVRTNRVLGVIEQSNDSRRIIFGFIQQWEANVEIDELSTRFELKLAILKLLLNCLAAQPNEYTLAHMLLGFGLDAEGGISLSVVEGGIGSGVSLLHSILDVVWDSRESDESGSSYDGNLCQLKNDCFLVLRLLWKAPISSSEILFVLRANKFLFSQFSAENTIKTTTVWDGVPFDSTEFFFVDAASSLCEFLRRRTSLFDYIALEIRQLTAQGASTMVSRYLSTLLGRTVAAEDVISNVHVLDLLDFLELEPPETHHSPDITWFNDPSFFVYVREDPYGVPLFNLPIIQEVLRLRFNELCKTGVIPAGQTEAVESEIPLLLEYLSAENQFRKFRGAKVDCLKSWTALVVVILEDCEFEPAAKTAFLLQALQTVLPKLESYSTSDIEGAQELSSLAHSLVSHLTFDTSTLARGRASDVANDRLYQLFRVSLRCIQSPMGTAKLREDFYNIAYRYLKGMSDLSLGQAKKASRHGIQGIKASGDRLLEVICNDAYSGEGTCKIMALLLLEALAALAAEEGSNYVVDALMRQNFLVVLVDSIKRVGNDLQNTKPEGINYLMRSFKAATGFLLRVSQTRVGAGNVMNAGLFQALRESRLFSVDPDLGVGFDDPQALSKYYELLHDVMRVVASCILSRGPQNRPALDQARQFLVENRNVALAVFKRHANIAGPRNGKTGDLKELTDMFVLLFSLTDFIEAEESGLYNR